MPRICAAAATLALALATPSVARPAEPANPLQDADARQHFATGMDAWLAEDFATAQRELELAYAIEPEPRLLYSLGQLARIQGDCETAVERFEAFLATDPSAISTEDTEANIERCREILAEAPPPEPDPEPTPEPPAPVLEPTPSPSPGPGPPTDRRRPDALGVSLTAVGGAMTVVGLGVFGGSFARQRNAEAELSAAPFEAGVAQARTMYWTGIGLASAGAVVVAIGVTRLLLVRKRRRAGRRSAFWPSPRPG